MDKLNIIFIKILNVNKNLFSKRRKVKFLKVPKHVKQVFFQLLFTVYII